MTRRSPPPRPGRSAAQEVAAMIRVDHAGEHGAVRIYEGQLAVLGRARTTAESARLIRHMAAQEEAHLKAFDALIAERGVRPTALAPLWHVAGFALGAATALLGETAAMACTAAVESVIDEHYAAQETRLRALDPALADTVAAFRADEIDHRETALAHGAEGAPAYPLLSGVIKAGCRMAIKLSERI